MNNTIFWDKIRVLVTGNCNYRCPFCHNEGQKKSYNHSPQITLTEFVQLVDYMKTQPISEFVISGGEPFLNKDIMAMIAYANDNLHCDLSCATNLSLIKEKDIEMLAKTRIKFNVQFPFVDDRRFSQSTGNGSLTKIMENIKKVRSAGLKIGLNMVIQSPEKNVLSEMVEFSIDEKLPLKLLPQIGRTDSKSYKEWVFPILQKYAISQINKGTGAIKWLIQRDNKTTSVLYIDSPCFTKDIDTCRNFGEVRIHPGLYVQSCIAKPIDLRLDFTKGYNFITDQFIQLWNDFTTC